CGGGFFNIIINLLRDLFDALCITYYKEQSMDQYLDDFSQKMAIKNFSMSTQKSYKGELKRFLSFCEQQNKPINSKVFQEYLFGLIKIKKLSEASLKQSIGAVKFFLSSLLTYPMH
ncbi:MAG: phage integrase N-terminal SAM-like domain-containing protein, partial [Clostridiales bacterium]|nr:phage integrase N-terminal SAM-like domain-containing protein [Clostridiales bacterium]